jgi:subtilisin family serine protease
VGRAVGAGITVVTIAGNITAFSSSNDACTISPGHLGASAAANGIITVGGTRSDDVMNPASKGGPCVDLLAPGHQIPAAPGSTFSGTSFAAPHVAGVVAFNLERKALLAPIYRTPAENEKDVKAMATPDVIFNLTAGSPNLLLYSRGAKRRACCG